MLNGPGYGKCGILKPNICLLDRMLYSCNIFILSSKHAFAIANVVPSCFFIFLIRPSFYNNEQSVLVRQLNLYSWSSLALFCHCQAKEKASRC